MTAKTIFSPSVARKLINKGNKVIDIKPDRNAKEKSLFVFEVDEKFLADFEEIVSKK